MSNRVITLYFSPDEKKLYDSTGSALQSGSYPFIYFTENITALICHRALFEIHEETANESGNAFWLYIVSYCNRSS